MEAEKGEPLDGRETAILDERLSAARVWLEDYAPERARMRVHDALPAEAGALDAEQRAFLATLAEDVTARSGEDWQAAIFTTAQAGGLPAGRAFAALYLAFLGRSNGPRAGWLLAGLDPDFVRTRLREASAAAKLPA